MFGYLTTDVVVYAVTHLMIGSVRYFINAPYKIRDRTTIGGDRTLSHPPFPVCVGYTN
ncbi:hypothetical protein [Nostoc sp.]|uniref:hypothetical protein n=1 Tax=Nostoc sp. TaxID=1180 RepID=UPI002FF7343B